jgi:hypothetical protein
MGDEYPEVPLTTLRDYWTVKVRAGQRGEPAMLTSALAVRHAHDGLREASQVCAAIQAIGALHLRHVQGAAPARLAVLAAR